MRELMLILCLTITAMLSGCNDSSSDDRLRKALGIPAGANISEPIVIERVQTLVPVGTAEPEIAEKVARLGIGKDTLSSYTLLSNRQMAIVRIEYGPSSFGVVKSQWIITFHLDSSMKLGSITAKRYLTGL